MSMEIFLTAGLICFGLAVVGMGMSVRILRNAEVTSNKC
jgi:hypothetical protein